MKEEKDILDIFSESFDQNDPAGEADWQEISLKNQSRQFWKWNLTKINVYYVGLIVVSFLGTFVIGTDYYITKHKITHGYEARIHDLEERIGLLEKARESRLPDRDQNLNIKQTKEKPTLNHKTQGHSADPISSLRKERRDNLKNVVSPEGDNSSQPELVIETPLENKANFITEEELNKEGEAVVNPGNTLDDSTTSVVLSNATPSVFEKEDETGSVHADLKVPELEEQAPVIKYVQDTIYEVDSAKVSRWKFKKTK